MRAITNKLLDGAECDTLLKIANAIILADSNTIKSQAKTITDQDDRYIKTEHLVDECALEKAVLTKAAKKNKNKLIWTKVGWAATAVAEAALIVYFMIKP